MNRNVLAALVFYKKVTTNVCVFIHSLNFNNLYYLLYLLSLILMIKSEEACNISAHFYLTILRIKSYFFSLDFGYNEVFE